MPVLNPKSRMISLRLSDEEFEKLRSLYRVHGSRSVSEFARNAMQKVIAEEQVASSNIEGRLQELDHKMSSLDQEVGRLIRMIEGRLAGADIASADAA